MAENAELGPVKMKGGKIGQNESKKKEEKPKENGPSEEMQNAMMAETMENNVEKEKAKMEDEYEEEERFFAFILIIFKTIFKYKIRK